MAAEFMDLWMGEPKYLTEELFIIPWYHAYADMGNSAVNPFLRLSNGTYSGYYFCMVADGHTAADLRALCNIRIKITTGVGTGDYLIAQQTIEEGYQDGKSVFCVNLKATGNIVIPKTGQPFTITTEVYTKYNSMANRWQDLYTFTQEACGIIYNSFSGETNIYSGRLYDYTPTSAILTDEHRSADLDFGWFTSQHSRTHITPQSGIYAKTYFKIVEDENHRKIFRAAVKVQRQGYEGSDDSGLAIYTFTTQVPPGWSGEPITYYACAVMSEYYTTTDFGKICIGFASLPMTRITQRSGVDSDLKPVITSVNISPVFCYNRNYMASFDYSRYNAYVQNHSYAALLVYADTYSEDIAKTTADLYIGGEKQSTTEKQAAVGSRGDVSVYFDWAGTDATIKVKVTGSEWGLESDEYTLGPFTVLPYIVPRIASTTYDRFKMVETQSDKTITFENHYYEPDLEGDYVRIRWAAEWSSLNGGNAKAMKMIIPNSTTTVAYRTVTIAAAALERGFLICPASTEFSYETVFILIDDYHDVEEHTSTSYQHRWCPRVSLQVDSGNVIMDFYGVRGLGIGIGKVAETMRRVDVRADWTLHLYSMTLGDYNYDSRTGFYSDQNFIDWMHGIEQQIAQLQSARNGGGS